MLLSAGVTTSFAHHMLKVMGAVYSWGTFCKSSNSSKVVERYAPGQVNDHLFQTRKGNLVYAVVDEVYIKESQDVGGLRCNLSNGDEDRFSKQVMIWKHYDRTFVKGHRLFWIITRQICQFLVFMVGLYDPKPAGPNLGWKQV